MKCVLLIITSLLAATAVQAGAGPQVLKTLSCEGSQYRVELEATHMKGDRIALLEWNVFSGSQIVEGFMSPLSYENESLKDFGGSTLGSELWVDGDTARLTFKDVTYTLKCR